MKLQEPAEQSFIIRHVRNGPSDTQCLFGLFLKGEGESLSIDLREQDIKKDFGI